MSRARCSRRRILEWAGLGSIAAFLPPLDLWLDPPACLAIGRAAAQAAGYQKRLVVFHFANGAPMTRWTPQGDSATSPSFILQGLGDMGNRVNVITGLSNEDLRSGTGGNPHAVAMLCTAGVLPRRNAQGQAGFAGGPSFDQAAVSHIGPARFPSLQLAPNARNMNEGWFSFSNDSAFTPMPFQTNASTFFTDVFASSMDPGTMAADLRAEQVINVAQAQIARSRGRVGSQDWRILQQHSQVLEDLKRSVSLGVGPNCPPVTAPNVGTDYTQPRVDAMMSMAVLALQCQLTNVLVFSIGASGGGPTYSNIPELQDIVNADSTRPDDHTISHEPYGRDANALDHYSRAARWKMEQLAKFLRQMSNAPDIGGSLLDHSAVVCFSELSEGNGHSTEFLPALVAGGLWQGAPGRHIRVPCRRVAGNFMERADNDRCVAADRTPLSNLWLSALRAVGISDSSIPTFGNATGTIAGI